MVEEQQLALCLMLVHPAALVNQYVTAAYDLLPLLSPHSNCKVPLEHVERKPC